MKHIVSFSGGMGSFAEAKACVDKFGKENTLLLFCDTLMEDEDLYRFVEDSVEFLGCEFVRLCYGKTPWELFEEQKFVANSRLDLCSRILKRELMNGKNAWLDKNFGYNAEQPILTLGGTPRYWDSGELMTKTVRLLNAEVHLGIDYTEQHRIKVVQDRMTPWIYRSTLVEDGRFIAKDFSEQFGIKKPRLYDLGFSHNNCGGFCVKAGLGHFKILFEKLPERYKQHEEVELRLNSELNTKPFLKKCVSGEIRYLTMKEYREEYLEQGNAEDDKFDIGGCACALPT